MEYGKVSTLNRVPPSWRNSGGRRRFRVTIGRLVAGSIPGRASSIEAWPNSLVRTLCLESVKKKYFQSER